MRRADQRNERAIIFDPFIETPLLRPPGLAEVATLHRHNVSVQPPAVSPQLLNHCEKSGLDGSAYGTHSMRRTKAAQIYKKTGNLRAVQLLLGHTKLESTVRYLGIEVDDALSISEQVEL